MQDASTIDLSQKLPDLWDEIDQLKSKAKDFKFMYGAELSDDFKRIFKTALASSSYGIEFFKDCVLIQSKKQDRMSYMSNESVVLSGLGVPLVRTIRFYQTVADAVIRKYQEEFKNLFPNTGGSDLGKDLRRRVYDTLKEGKNTRVNNCFRECVAKMVAEQTDDKETQIDSSDKLFRFATDTSSWGGGKGIDRQDCINSPILSTLGLIAVDNSLVADLGSFLAELPDNSLQSLYDSASVYLNSASGSGSTGCQYVDLSSSKKRLSGGYNLIVYGAPGTGKSTLLKKLTGSNPNNTRRVIFHSEYTYYDFVGSYKPVPVYAKDDQELVKTDGSSIDHGTPFIDYKFVPGPFTEMLVRATLHPESMFTLLIEEINRADAPAVFGEIFQLLDRDPNGNSEYSCEIGEEFRQYLMSVGMGPYISEGLFIPSNMNIFATMNSADQGVNVLDSAFKRRWIFEYLKIDIGSAVHKDIPIKYNGHTVKWGDFIAALNKKLSLLMINEDSLIGPYFIKPEELIRKPANQETDEMFAYKQQHAIDKLLLYIWDDVLRYKKDQGVYAPTVHSFTDLCANFALNDVLLIGDLLPLEQSNLE